MSNPPNYYNMGIAFGKSARVDFKPEEFENLIENKGYRVLWEQAMYCTCYYDPLTDQYDGQPNYNCPHCRGVGFTYLEPQEIKVVASSISNPVEQPQIGLHELGSAYVSSRAKHIIGMRDRFTFLDFVIRYSQIIQLSGEDEDSLKYSPTELIAVRTQSGIFKPGEDCILTKKGIKWLKTPGHEGEVVSVLYKGLPRYIALGPIHELRGTYVQKGARGLEAFARLPQQFQVKREDLLDQNAL